MKLESLIPKLIDSAMKGEYVPILDIMRKTLIDDDEVKVICEYDERSKGLYLRRFHGRSCREVLSALSVDKKNRRYYPLVVNTKKESRIYYPLVVNTKNGSFAIIDYNHDRVLEIVEKATKNGTLKLR